ncbi:hypothetical protein L6452_05013 [Arctium lappa]|uniref:Uncharacterized protein n=1 Tax=Arctium lappa TaxID=4217 RepID=A0ACB9EFI2_ARCLA|nr:hypothetical protein L6452_05013 [Arctium lappa]
MVKQKELLTKDSRGLKLFHGRIWVPKFGGNRELLLEEAHKSKYSIHPGSMKMYRDLKLNYWWPVMKLDVANYVERSSNQERALPCNARNLANGEVGQALYRRDRTSSLPVGPTTENGWNTSYLLRVLPPEMPSQRAECNSLDGNSGGQRESLRRRAGSDIGIKDK